MSAKQKLHQLLSEIPKHMDDTDLCFIDDLLPWSTQPAKMVSHIVFSLFADCGNGTCLVKLLGNRNLSFG